MARQVTAWTLSWYEKEPEGEGTRETKRAAIFLANTASEAVATWLEQYPDVFIGKEYHQGLEIHASYLEVYEG